MSDYIKREDAIAEAKAWSMYGKDDLVTRIERIKAVDVVEVRHGRWKILRPQFLQLDRRDSLFECSECGANRIRRTGEILNYCPNCGAKMDGEEQEHE